MEEFDDLVPNPDENGHMELKYRGWKSVDEVIWTMGREILSIDLSYNSLSVRQCSSSPPNSRDNMVST